MIEKQKTLAKRVAKLEGWSLIIWWTESQAVT
jgi:hypothetical protein